MAHPEVQPAATYTFDNGPSCKGEGAIYGEGEDAYSLDLIAITGRYPEGRQWARNDGSEEIVRVIRGTGALALRSLDGSPAQIIPLAAEGSTVEGEPVVGETEVIVPKGTWFAWNSTDHTGMNISMLNQPPFTPETYRVQTEEAIQGGAR